MKEGYRAGIIGAGMMGKLHADALNRLPGVDVVSIANPNPETAERTARRYGIPKTYRDIGEMLDSENLDTVHVCTPNNTHFEYCRMAIERGIHVFCEKPLTMTSEEGEELARMAQEHGVTGAVNFNYRNNAMVQEIRERVLTGDSGRIYFIHGKYLQDWLMYDSDYSWRLDRERNGASRAIADIGSHLFDTIQCVSDKKIASVFCTLFTGIKERKKPREAVHTFSENRGEYDLVNVDTEDGAAIQFTLEDGTPGAVIVSQVCGGHKNDLSIEMECEIAI